MKLHTHIYINTGTALPFWRERERDRNQVHQPPLLVFLGRKCKGFRFLSSLSSMLMASIRDLIASPPRNSVQNQLVFQINNN